MKCLAFIVRLQGNSKVFRYMWKIVCNVFLSVWYYFKHSEIVMHFSGTLNVPSEQYGCKVFSLFTGSHRIIPFYNDFRRKIVRCVLLSCYTNINIIELICITKVKYNTFTVKYGAYSLWIIVNLQGYTKD